MPNHDARSLEAELLALCSRAAAGGDVRAANEVEANVLGLAARVLSGPRPQCENLDRAAAAYFAAHPEVQPLSAHEMTQRGWIIGVPRLRDALERALKVSA